MLCILKDINVNVMCIQSLTNVVPQFYYYPINLIKATTELLLSMETKSILIMSCLVVNWIPSRTHVMCVYI